MRVDAHQHFWQYSTEEYGWIDEGMAAIRRDFFPADLAPLLAESGVDATVAVQARQSLEETEWLLDLATENAWIAGVVGWAPLADMSAEAALEKLASNAKLKGVRHVLQAEPSEYMLRDDFNRGVALLRHFSLTYDVLIVEHQLPAAIEFVDCHPNQPFVLDHLAKPSVAKAELKPWRKNILELARRPHICCKLSGVVTEADYADWTVDALRPYVETALEAFGPTRMMFGSDWPVCTVAATYARWTGVVHEFVNPLSNDEQAMILGRNATAFYGLDDSSASREVQSA